MFRFVVLTEKVRGFDTFEEARSFALGTVPAVVCERIATATGSRLEEVARHDLLFDPAEGEARPQFVSLMPRPPA